MKHLTIILAILFASCITCNAQVEHLKFKGIPITGTLSSFTNQLKAKGLEYQGTNNGAAALTGDFAGYKNCIIGVIANQSDMVSVVFVLFPEMEKWSELENCYTRYKNLLTEKYGIPTNCIEEFQGDYVRNDNDKLHELKMDRCKFASMFSCNQGDILLQINYKDGECRVMLIYSDKANQEKLNEQIMDDL